MAFLRHGEYCNGDAASFLQRLGKSILESIDSTINCNQLDVAPHETTQDQSSPGSSSVLN